LFIRIQFFIHHSASVAAAFRSLARPGITECTFTTFSTPRATDPSSTHSEHQRAHAAAVCPPLHEVAGAGGEERGACSEDAGHRTAVVCASGPLSTAAEGDAAAAFEGKILMAAGQLPSEAAETCMHLFIE
jgi:hypothetical protein